jgi:(2Fe-2S) ferredoxin
VAALHSYCSEMSLAQDEPLHGTAERVDVWILLEYVPVWTARITTDNALADATRQWLAGLVAGAEQRGLRPRLQFIRQPEAERSGINLYVSNGGALRRIEAPTYGALTRYTLDALLTVPDCGESLYFVCTNGQRDVCCARFGLPLYAALRQRVSARVWQTTHVGGHRFAPNVLTLPQGALYGRVQPDEADAFLALTERGRLAARWLRGRSSLHPAAQAAEAALAARGVDTDGPVALEADGEGAYRAAFGAHTVRVRAGQAYDVIASCGETEPKRITPWQIDWS